MTWCLGSRLQLLQLLPAQVLLDFYSEGPYSDAKLINKRVIDAQPLILLRVSIRLFLTDISEKSDQEKLGESCWKVGC